jgi:DNA-binding response OmpR family regulator
MSSETSTAADSRRRVLVVDDYPDAADMLAEVLELRGDQVAVAHDAEAALAIAAEFAPQIALLDLRLPKMDGFELASELRRRHGAGLVLIAMTGLSRPEERARATEVGFGHYLVKPIDLAELQALLETLSMTNVAAATP